MTEHTVEPRVVHVTPLGSEIRCRLYQDGAPAASPEHLDAMRQLLQSPGNVIWLDVVDPDREDLDLLKQQFGLHPLAVEDAVSRHERPKIEQYPEYWFLTVQATTYEENGLTFHEVAIFAGPNFVVTVRHTPLYPLAEIEYRMARHTDDLRPGAGFLLYTVLDTIVDGYIPVSENFQDRVDELENLLFDRRHKDTDLLPEIFRMKQEAQRFRHAVVPMREILAPLAREDLHLYSSQIHLYFRDIYDHATLVIDHLDSMRDLVSSAMEIHLSVVANRQNEVAKQLTVVATFFLPLTFIVGFFGQNFSWLVGHIASTQSFALFGIGLEVATLIVTVVALKARGWF